MGVLRQVQEAQEAAFRRRRRVHAARREEVQLECEDQDHEDAHPPGRHREGDRREVGDGAVRLGANARGQPHAERQAQDGGDDQAGGEQEGGVGQPFQDDIGDLAAPRRALEHPRFAQVERHHVQHGGGEAPHPAFVEVVELLQLDAARRQGALERLGVADGLREAGAQPSDLLADLRSEQAVGEPRRAQGDDEGHQDGEEHRDEREGAYGQGRRRDMGCYALPRLAAAVALSPDAEPANESSLRASPRARQPGGARFSDHLSGITSQPRPDALVPFSRFVLRSELTTNGLEVNARIGR